MTDSEVQPIARKGQGATASTRVGTGGRNGRAPVGDRVAMIVFAVLVAVAAPLLLFKLGRYHWFARDEWYFVAERETDSINDYFRLHNGTHWSTVPVLVYRLLWKVVGLRSYLPYQACLVALHLAAVVLLRLIMRRSGVGPWLATAAASSMLLFGPGAQNIIWAFQIGFTASLVFGLVHLLLAGHDGPVDRRDGLALAAGALSLMSSGAGVTMVVVVGMATLLRRGWTAAALHTAPLAGLYAVYALIAHPETTTVFGRPPVSFLLRWMRSSEIGTFRGLGHFTVVAIALAVLLVAGLLLAVATQRGPELRSRLAMPMAMLIGGLVFSAVAAQGRWYLGEEGARAGRFLYMGAALTLPALAMAADAFARRWRVLTPALMAVFLIAVPANSDAFVEFPFGPGYHENNERILTAAARMPFAREVPRDVRPIPTATYSLDLTIGFLLDARDAGKLPALSGAVPQRVVNELKVRLGVAQGYAEPVSKTCRAHRGPLDLSPPKGSVYGFLSDLNISTRAGSKATSAPVRFTPGYGQTLTVELDRLHLRIEPVRRNQAFMLCRTA